MSRLSLSSNALDILKKDHREIVTKFKLYEKLDRNDKKQQLAADICNCLTILCTCEEDLIYPLAQQIVDKSPIQVGEIELNHIRALVEAVRENSTDDAERDALMKVLCEYVHTHIRQEEATLFPLLDSSVLDLKKIGVAVLDLKLKTIERIRKLTEFEVMELPSVSVKMN